MVFDKFKNWRKQDSEPSVDCPLCGTKNLESAKECSQCLYQLGKASFEQVTSVDESEANSLFDELLADIEDAEEDEEVIDWSKGTFTMDDVTIDVEEYGEEDEIKLSKNPTLAMTVETPDSSEEDVEDYVLTSADAPEFVTKFEVPKSELEPLEQLPKQKLTLVEPTSVGAEEVDIVATDEIPDANGDSVEEEVVSSESEVVTIDSLVSLKKAELISIAKDAGLPVTGTKPELASRILSGEVEEDPVSEESVIESEKELPLPPPPSTPLPPVVPATLAEIPPPPKPVPTYSDPLDDAFDRASPANPPRIPRIPKPPVLPHLVEEETTSLVPENNGFWPWPQQDEWTDRDVAMKVKEAMEEVKRKNTAQVTVILDEVGPHLGERTKLLYPIGALLQRIGRASTVDKMIALAVESKPEDPDVQMAKSKLRP